MKTTNEFISENGFEAVIFVGQTLWADGIYLLLSILIAVVMAVYIDPVKARHYLMKKKSFLIPGSVGFGALTPLCACGTMAVVISLLTTALPWGPIMAFLVSSPLMSPDTFVLISGFLGVKFAVVLAFGSIVLGLTAGYLTHLIETKTNFLKDQFRAVSNKKNQNKAAETNYRSAGAIQFQYYKAGNACCASVSVSKTQTFVEKLKIKEFAQTFISLGVKKILPLFLIFAFIAYAVKAFVPTVWIMELFSGNNIFSVPLAALIGLPLYVSDSTVAPLLQVLQQAGASNGSLLAFMIAGPGTGLGVIIGLNVVLKRKALLLYLAYIFFGAVVLGYLYDVFGKML
jgi:uncharacterized membrane protein YraQ (UPF0718 family)